jgi:hypothetical protein
MRVNGGMNASGVATGPMYEVARGWLDTINIAEYGETGCKAVSGYITALQGTD